MFEDDGSVMVFWQALTPIPTEGLYFVYFACNEPSFASKGLCKVSLYKLVIKKVSITRN